VKIQPQWVVTPGKQTNPINTPLFPVAERDLAFPFHPQRAVQDERTVKGTPIGSSGVTSTPLSPAAIRAGKVASDRSFWWFIDAYYRTQLPRDKQCT